MFYPIVIDNIYKLIDLYIINIKLAIGENVNKIKKKSDIYSNDNNLFRIIIDKWKKKIRDLIWYATYSY